MVLVYDYTFLPLNGRNLICGRIALRKDNYVLDYVATNYFQIANLSQTQIGG